MKKSFLALIIASLMLVGCSSGNTSGSEKESGSQGSDSQESQSSEGSESSGGDVVVPTEEGKVTFYFQLGEGSLALPSYCGFFLTGAFNGWGTAVEDVVELKQLSEGSDIYYGMFATETEITEFSYQLTAGYQPDAGTPASGVDWEFKSVECAVYAYGENPTFEVVDGKANLGAHTWDAMPADPAESTISNLTVTVPFAAAVPEYVDIHLAGGSPFSWTLGDDTIMTASADRKTFSLTLDSIIGNTYSVKVLACYHGAATDWDHTILDNGEGGDYKLAVLKTYGDDYTLNIAADSWQEGDVFTVDWATFMPEKGEDVALTLKVVFDAAITLDKLYVIGNYTSWEAEELTTEDNITYTHTGTYAGGSTIEFGICADTGWHRALKLGGNNNSAKLGDAATEVTLTAAEGAAAFFNACTGTEEDWVNFEYGQIEDAAGTRVYVLNNLPTIYETAAAGDEVSFYGKILGSYGTSTKEFYVGYGDYAMDVYGATLPEGVAVGDTVEVTGKISVYKGLIEVNKDVTYTAAPNLVINVNTLALDGTNFSKVALSRPATLTGTVVEAKTIDGASNVTAKVKVGEKTVAVYIKKEAGLDYTALNAAFATADAAVSLTGYVGIFDSAATVDYATSTGYQLVNPSVVVAA